MRVLGFGGGALLAGALLSGCFFRGRGTELISSHASSYSPVVSFTANVEVSDSVRIRIDRVRVLSPGEVFEGMGAVTGAVEMQALIVGANPMADLRLLATRAEIEDRNGSRKPWIELSGGQTRRIADSLHVGVEHVSGPVRYALPLPARFDRRANWIAFRITGEANALPARLAGDAPQVVFKMPPIRVFACSQRNLDGKTDQARVKQMTEMYSSAC